MGNKASEPTKVTLTKSSDDRVEYTANIIDDIAINKVKLNHKSRLSAGDFSLMSEAQSKATHELNRTMKHCALHIHLSKFLIIMRSGDCSNKIIIRRTEGGKIEWNFAEKGVAQHAYDAGKSVKDMLSGLLQRLAETAIGIGKLAITL